MATSIEELLFDDFSHYAGLMPLVAAFNRLPDVLHALGTERALINRETSRTRIINSIVDPDAYIGDFTLIRNSIIERGVRIGGHVEINMSVIRAETEVPHFNNIGYSIVGKRVLLGAFASTSSRRLDDIPPRVRVPEMGEFVAESAKYGALIGDDVRIGSHVCINPFTVIRKQIVVHPGTVLHGFVQ